MTFRLSDEQKLLRNTLRDFLNDRHDLEARKRDTSNETGRNLALWNAFANELGLLGLPFAESQGGLGYGSVETMIVMQELGRALVTEPYLEAILIAGQLLRHADPTVSGKLVPKIIAGEEIIAFAHAEPRSRDIRQDVQTRAEKQPDGSYRISGRKAVVVGAPWANHLVISARTAGERRDAKGISLFLIDASAAGVTRKDYPTLDGRRASDILFDHLNVPAGALIAAEHEALPVIEDILDVATAAICAEAGGVMGRLVEDTQAYTNDRRQGGKLLSEYQVIQHRLADMRVSTEQVLSLARMAANKLDAAADERVMAVSAAKAYISNEVKKVAQTAVQLHGGMGMTDEIAAGNLFRRSMVIETQFGSADFHLSRYEHLSFR